MICIHQWKSGTAVKFGSTPPCEFCKPEEYAEHKKRLESRPSEKEYYGSIIWGTSIEEILAESELDETFKAAACPPYPGKVKDYSSDA